MYLSLSLFPLLLSVSYSARIPFICKIRKVDCSIRPDSVCCKYVTTTATTTTTTATTEIVDVENDTETLKEIKDVNVIQAEPSNIDEVVVKITGEAVEVNYPKY